MAAQEVSTGVYLLPGSTRAFMGTYPPNVFLVRGQRTSALIDAGYADEHDVSARIQSLEELGAKPGFIFLTHLHPDHAGGATRLREATGALVLAASAEVTPGRSGGLVDAAVADLQELDLGGRSLEIILTPGHSAGHICLFEQRDRLLFSGDHVPGEGTTIIGPEGDMAQYVHSLRRLLEYDISTICPGHGPLVRTPRRKIEELIQHRLDREEQALACIRAGKHTLERMVKDIYPELDPRLLWMAKEQMRSHLVKLIREGRVKPAPEPEGPYTLA